jgi:rubrerythrin
MTEITTLDDLLIYAHELEQDAVARYQELVDQMIVHNQPELVELFQTMVRAESLHVDKVRVLASDRELPRLAPWDYRWLTQEAPESVPIGQERYRMRPRQALELALAAEERAHAFFAHVADSSPDPAARQMAAELAEEERQHADLVREWLNLYPVTTDADALIDLDEPMAQD